MLEWTNAAGICQVQGLKYDSYTSYTDEHTSSAPDVVEVFISHTSKQYMLLCEFIPGYLWVLLLLLLYCSTQVYVPGKRKTARPLGTSCRADCSRQRKECKRRGDALWWAMYGQMSARSSQGRRFRWVLPPPCVVFEISGVSSPGCVLSWGAGVDRTHQSFCGDETLGIGAKIIPWYPCTCSSTAAVQ